MPERLLEDVAVELYSGPPAEFIGARNARADDVSDPDLANQIRALRKPSVAAWIVNVFARERAGELGQALQLAEELREAQSDMDASTLAELGRRRRALTDKLARDAAALASARGARVTASTLAAVQQTIAAAFFDRDAAAAVASGRLVRELEPSSGVPFDVAAAVGGGAPSAPVAAGPQVDEVAARWERRQAERAVREAEQDLARAQRELDRADREAADVARRLEQLTGRERELDAELARVREQLRKAQGEAPVVDERRASAEAAVVAAEHAFEAARRAADA